MCPPISTAKLLWGTVTILQVIALRLQTQPSSGQRLATVLAPQLPVNHCAQLTEFVCSNSTAKLKASVLSM